MHNFGGRGDCIHAMERCSLFRQSLSGSAQNRNYSIDTFICLSIKHIYKNLCALCVVVSAGVDLEIMKALGRYTFVHKKNFCMKLSRKRPDMLRKSLGSSLKPHFFCVTKISIIICKFNKLVIFHVQAHSLPTFSNC